jgi:hypothetical protein
MTGIEKIKIIVLLAICGILAYCSNFFSDKPLFAAYLQISSITGCFVGYHLAWTKAYTEQCPLYVHLAATLQMKIFDDLGIPLMALSIALGNILATHTSINSISTLWILVASLIIVIVGCILGVCLGYIWRKVF